MSSTMFSSDTSQEKWADQLNDHFIVYVENPPSIFKVPKNILDTNPEAYAPREIGIGAYHHFRHDLDDMESRKLEAIKTFLNPEQLRNFKSLVVDRVRALEPAIRSCYDKYLDLDSGALAWAMVIDGVFLLHLFTRSSPDAGKRAKEVLMMENQFNVLIESRPDAVHIANIEVLMMENQFPCIVPAEIPDALPVLFTGSSSESDARKLAEEVLVMEIPDALPDLPTGSSPNAGKEVLIMENLLTGSNPDAGKKVRIMKNRHTRLSPVSRKEVLMVKNLLTGSNPDAGKEVLMMENLLTGSSPDAGKEVLTLKNLLTGSSPDAGKLAKEVLMMENQFPCFVLKEIRDALHGGAIIEEDGENGDISDLLVEEFDELFSVMSSYCRCHSPLHIENGAFPNSPHILDLMYRMVVIKLSHVKPPRMMDYPMLRSGLNLQAGRKLQEIAGIVAGLTGLNTLKLVASLPLEQFFSLFGNANSSTDSSVDQIQIPSLSKLHWVSGIQFEKLTSGRAVVRYDEKTRKLYLPVIRLNADSEVILRNLVAYESALGPEHNVVSGYVDLMCGLIDTAKDVDLLKKKGIIDTDLASGEVAKMFNGINKSGEIVGVLEEATQKLNETYDSSIRVRCFRFVKNHLIPSEKSVKLVLGILLVLLLTLQAFCQVYGCSAHWFGNINSLASI